MTSPEVSQHRIKIELPEVTLGDQNQWHNLFSSQPDRFSTYLFGDNIEYSQGKRPHNKKKGKSIPILANKITPFIFYAENINFFPFHINGFFFFFFYSMAGIHNRSPCTQEPCQSWWSQDLIPDLGRSQESCPGPFSY